MNSNVLNTSLKIVLVFIVIAAYFSYSNDSMASETQIQETVKKLLIEEQDIPHQNIQVMNKDFVIYVSGAVETHLQANRIIEIISSLENVKDVNTDDLEIISSKEFFSDVYITAKAKGKIKYLALSDQIAPGYQIHIETTNGVVHIFGDVVDDHDIDIITDSINSIIDVKSVRTNLICK